jgi:heterodisulfide reductase subunit B
MMASTTYCIVICGGCHQTQDTGRRQRKQKNTTQYVVDAIIHKTHDEDKGSKKTQHNMWWMPSYTRHRTKTKEAKKHNTIYVGHHYAQTNTNNVKKT